MQDPKIFRLMQQFRKALLAQDAAAMQRVIEAYQLVYDRLQGRLDALLQAILAQGDGPLSRAQVVRLSQYKALAEQLTDELGKFGVVLENQVSVSARAALLRGDADSIKLLKSIWGAHSFIRADFARLPREAAETLIGFLSPKSPLYKSIHWLGSKDNAQEIMNGLLDGMISGASPRVTASRLQGLFTRNVGKGLTDALRITRTAQLYSYRAASQTNYQANSDVVTGWYWMADVGGDPEPCMSCLAQHGSRHDLDEILDDHDCGRCSQVPEVMGQNPLGDMQSGEAYFSSLPEATQRALMGKGKFTAWQDGQFTFSQLSQQVDHPTWGHVRTTPPLKDLVPSEADA